MAQTELAWNTAQVTRWYRYKDRGRWGRWTLQRGPDACSLFWYETWIVDALLHPVAYIVYSSRAGDIQWKIKRRGRWPALTQ